jgi:hypothetical protein
LSFFKILMITVSLLATGESNGAAISWPEAAVVSNSGSGGSFGGGSAVVWAGGCSGR